MHMTYQIIVTGKVQGVGFRRYTQAQAIALSIVGYVQNLSDGSVQATIQGTHDNIIEMLDWFHLGPSYALVDSLEYKDVDPINASTFEIRR